ncbi:MAG: endonuclease III [Elusimicrobia bacterium]|nr:MAG: endonuclease III [Elusimicrobiota bacterium]
MKNTDIPKAVLILRREIKRWKESALGVVQHSTQTPDPFLILISCVISLRTKDAVTMAASNRLFRLAKTPKTLAALSPAKIAKAIYPASFFRVKSHSLKGIATDIVRKYDGKTPDEIDELLTLKGVGRKTANLVVTLGFNKPGICVDIHVHRISNRWGYIKTKTPEESEIALRKKLPKRYWIEYNDLLVPYGQHLCAPVSPRCSECKLSRYCDRVGVTKSR